MTNKPRKALTRYDCEAWWYAQHSGIDVLIRTLPNGPTVSCWITKRQLRAWLAKVDAKTRARGG